MSKEKCFCLSAKRRNCRIKKDKKEVDDLTIFNTLNNDIVKLKGRILRVEKMLDVALKQLLNITNYLEDKKRE